MAEIQPFRGWRFDLAQVGDLSDVTAPPYDVIDAQMQSCLYKQHPCNVVRLILNRAEPGDSTPEAPYKRAADFLRNWQAENVLIQEPEEAVYVYHQAFDWEGVHFVRKGFLACVRLEEFENGHIFPHEQTLSGPKADRLALTKACQANLSPIFGLYPDDDAEIQSVLEDSIRTKTAIEAGDSLGIVHRLWPITDHTITTHVREAIHDLPIFIADGHHRYEIALAYRDWLREQGRLNDTTSAPNFVMMMFVGMRDPGLAILPTHRLISGLPNLTVDQLQSALEGHFEIERMGAGTAGAQETWGMMDADGGQDVLGFGTAVDGQWALARVNDNSLMADLAPDHSDEWRSLGVSILHKLVLEHLLAQRFPNMSPECRYVHLLAEVTAAQQDHTCDLACLVPPASIEDVRQIASQFEKMPPKSTYFYPKLLSGLVINSLK